MKVEQFVMAYGVEQDRLRAILPEGFVSLRPVLRINAEVQDDRTGYVEFHTAVEREGKKGWLNIGYWKEVPFKKQGKTTTFFNDLLEISFTGVEIEGSCPAEKDNAGCYFTGDPMTLPAIPTEMKTAYPKQAFTVEHEAVIPCEQVLGTYRVKFDRTTE